jgi:CPA2 family monovalent cation:H+ antiporter-2
MAAAIELSSFKEPLILLATAGVVVPLVHRFNVSPVLGFMAAGALLGPHGLGMIAEPASPLSWFTISNPRDIDSLAELGVVFLLFVIGLELSPQRLVTMRRRVFGLGSLQVLLCGGALAGIARLLNEPPRAAILIGLALALSSTAIVLELLARQDRLVTHTGRTSFAVLLLQDLAVVPILFLVGMLSRDTELPILTGLGTALLQAALVLAVIVGFGVVALRPLFRQVAATDSPELFMATTLFVVVGASVLTAAAGMSMALGAFVAGLLLAETEYQRAIEAMIEPFKGLLLGVFFFSVGMSIDIGTVIQRPALVLLGAAGLILIKAVLFLPLARLFGLDTPSAIESSLLLGPGGEFAFIIIGLASTAGIVAGPTAAVVLAVVSLSMAALPLIATASRRASEVLARRARPALTLVPEAVAPAPASEAPAIIVGYGRVGEVVAEMLAEHKVPHLVTDRDVRLIEKGRANGHAVHFGDAKNPQFLETCGIRQAPALIITIHIQKDIDEIVKAAQEIRPDVTIISRARDADHARHLYAEGVADAVPETIEASLQLSEAALVNIGVPTGPVIASIHERRDRFRAMLQDAVRTSERPIRAIRAKQALED